MDTIPDCERTLSDDTMVFRFSVNGSQQQWIRASPDHLGVRVHHLAVCLTQGQFIPRTVTATGLTNRLNVSIYLTVQRAVELTLPISVRWVRETHTKPSSVMSLSSVSLIKPQKVTEKFTRPRKILIIQINALPKQQLHEK